LEGILLIYGKSSIYITGTAKISSNDPISDIYDIFFIGIIIDRNDERIIDVTCNMVRDVTSDFIKSILIGYNLREEEDQIINDIRDRFHGIAQKAVIAALKDARNRYMMLNSN
jgi:hypothetical protein